MSITDLPAFNDTLNDVFSSGGKDDFERVSSDESVSSPRSKHMQAKEVEQGLLERISEECAVFGELTSVDWLAKVVGLYENLNSKVAVMLVGGPFSGKSECIRALAPFVAKEMRMERSEFNNRNVEVTSIFPKALSFTQLYGKWHQESMDWYDGVLPHHFRAIEEARNDGDSRLAEAMWWTVFDGPVDPLWTDGIGTVLGEDAQLQLPHGEFVQAPKHNKFIFQVTP
jgi:dynein heavy chain